MDNTVKVQEVKQEVKPEEPKQLSLSEYKTAMRLFFTVRHDIVEACGHKYDKLNPPRHANCEACWWAWFQLHGELVQIIDEALHKEGPGIVIQRYGVKFYKNFLRFMSTVAHLKDLERINGEDRSTDSKTDDSIGGVQEVTSVREAD